jgi:hypothetical protein
MSVASPQACSPSGGCCDMIGASKRQRQRAGVGKGGSTIHHLNLPMSIRMPSISGWDQLTEPDNRQTCYFLYRITPLF